MRELSASTITPCQWSSASYQSTELTAVRRSPRRRRRRPRGLRALVRAAATSAHDAPPAAAAASASAADAADGVHPSQVLFHFTFTHGSISSNIFNEGPQASIILTSWSVACFEIWVMGGSAQFCVCKWIVRWRNSHINNRQSCHKPLHARSHDPDGILGLSLLITAAVRFF